MFDSKDYILIFLSIATSIVANFLTNFSIHVLYLSFIFILLLIIYLLNSRLLFLRYIGIKKVEKNISSETDTEKLLSLVQDNFYMMGRGGSRFVEAKNIQEILSRVDRRKTVRFLILDPKSSASVHLSKERNVVDSHISDIISASIRTIEQFKAKGYNIEYRFYDNSDYVPIFRVVVIDDKEAYVSFYQRGETGKASFQMVLEATRHRNDLFNAFRTHFESMWEIGRPKVN